MELPEDGQPTDITEN